MKNLFKLPIVGQFTRFAGIGFLNTAVDFAVLNLLIALTGFISGVEIAVINAISFTIAVAHSYWWNKYWAFSKKQDDLRGIQNIGQFVAASFIGGLIILLSAYGANQKFDTGYFIILIAALIIGEYWLWKYFRLQKDEGAGRSGREMVLFVLITLIGMLINTGIVAGVTSYVSAPYGLEAELWANLAKVAATVISLAWNFIGYKIFVFKK